MQPPTVPKLIAKLVTLFGLGRWLRFTLALHDGRTLRFLPAFAAVGAATLRIVKGDKDAPHAVCVSRAYGCDRKVIIRRGDGSSGEEPPTLSR